MHTILPSLQLSQIVDDFPISVDDAEKIRSDFVQERAELSVISSSYSCILLIPDTI